MIEHPGKERLKELLANFDDLAELRPEAAAAKANLTMIAEYVQFLETTGCADVETPEQVQELKAENERLRIALGAVVSPSMLEAIATGKAPPALNTKDNGE